LNGVRTDWKEIGSATDFHRDRLIDLGRRQFFKIAETTLERGSGKGECAVGEP
jgi:hypothetical protein